MQSRIRARALYTRVNTALKRFDLTWNQAATMSDDELIGTIDGLGTQGLLAIRLYPVLRQHWLNAVTGVPVGMASALPGEES